MRKRIRVSRARRSNRRAPPFLIAHVDSNDAGCELIGLAALKGSMDRFDIKIILDPRNPLVTINGRKFWEKGSVRETVRVARELYSEADFEEVDALIAQHYGIMAATREVARRHGYSPSGFYRQYNDRHASKKRKYFVEG